jgi:hypothetical protein
MAMVILGVDAAAPPLLEDDVLCLPPDEQAVRASVAAESARTALTARLERIMIGCLSDITASTR